MNDDRNKVVRIITIPLDDETLERLGRFSRDVRKPPAIAAASLLRDLLLDDELAHLN